MDRPVPRVDVLIPSFGRPGALALTLSGLAAQTLPGLRVIVSDQTDGAPAFDHPEVAAVSRIVEASGREVVRLRNLPRRGLAQQRQFLLDHARAPYALCLDNDVWLESDLLDRLLGVIEGEQCGFVGSAVIGLSFIDDVRPHEQAVEFWDGPVQPEIIEWRGPAHDRHRLHNAANLYHLAQRLELTPGRERLYRVAWVGGCVLYDREKLVRSGGFEFWRRLPAEHCGEDVLAQLRVMARFGGCGLLPSGAYHLELPTSVVDRRVNAPDALPDLLPRPAGQATAHPPAAATSPPAPRP